MAAFFDLPVSTTNVGNTGTPSDDVFMGLPQTLWFAPIDAKITESDLTSLETFLDNKTVAAAAARWFPIQSIIGTEDVSVEPVIATSGYGVESQEKGTLMGYQFQLSAGVGLTNELMKWNDRIIGFAVADDKSRLWGTTSGDDLKAFTGRVSVTRSGFKDGANGKYTLVRVVSTKASELNSLRSVYEEDVDPSNIAGLVNIEVKEVSSTGATATITIKDKVAKTDMGTLYETALKDVTNWSAVNRSTGAAVTITSITYQSATGDFDVVFDVIASANVTLIPQLASAWYAELSAKYELNSLNIDLTIT